MKNYLKLTHFEVHRFAKLYAVLLVVTLLSQIIGVFVISKRFLNHATEIMVQNRMNEAQFMEEYGPISMANITNSMWFVSPIAFGAVTLLLYVFLIWYRDWFGKNTFIYRLLMLPTERINIYLAKATAIFLMVLGLVSWQLILLSLETKLLAWLTPSALHVELPLRETLQSLDFLHVIIPYSIMEFFIHYGLGLMFVFVVFTAILLERSFRLKGIIFGGIYVGIVWLIFLSPELSFSRSYFFPIEIFLIHLLLSVIIIGGSIWLSYYLLRKRIMV
ncbi:hypothetical protein [Halalkalibacterium halodurans]|jgi:hypothetical protein|uniref:BH2649 protein n=2 Tax=Halalkalibacterium halodurans TaxID=86665 RepID=Q9K9J7_HALH5|nr:hypothetical protein [Halalkalibacterium halodurans]MED4164733.1 hypothetical protein [Halalkalibacterium halodurans]MED4173414.1 hypothetical protein [Halalkalibacterium halodurans]TES56022.1 hypothetical protein E2L07_06150 [Halalkalibacterium halodurans]TPE66560.1 hypothetical protein AMD02_018770 [Halalkalibacterium halodurans]BAB06368.1 BH2649 [Halalkalibacterium halodurans C-125]